ncbi:cytochrome P450 [Smaragdicoccus niigatensis]|uniref:cytochrome P450 n=1 Tax=Smaragdicoccus niigatensis TaxID=359359 RepID=UPI00036B0E7E|nr:cytochrome P450 [Smaragdicoccus niigatensis]
MKMPQHSTHPFPPPPGSDLKAIPGHAGQLPYVGDTIALMQDVNRYLKEGYEADGPIAWRRLFGFNIVALTGPDTWGVVHQNRDKAFSHAEGWSRMMGAFYHDAIMLKDFDDHMFHKRILQSAFGRAKLLGYLDGMNQTIDATLDTWPAGKDFRVSPAIKQMALNIATKTFMGVEPGERADKMNRAFEDILEALGAIVRFRTPGSRIKIPVLDKHLPGTTWARGLKGRAFLEREIGRLIPEKRAGDGSDLLSVLCHATSEDGDTFTDQQIIDHMIFIMFAAHDTSTLAMTMMVHHLGKHPEWQDRCRAEALALGDHPTFEELEGMESLDLVLKETLRLNAPVRQMFRATVKDTEVLGYHLPKGTLCIVAPHINHHLPEYWTDPEKFDPERFSEARREDKAYKDIYVPFGSHAHKCIGMYFAGMEIKSTLHQMLRKFEWSVPADYEIPWSATVLPKVKDGLPIRLERRPS